MKIFLFTLVFLSLTQARAKPQFGYNIDLRARYASHLQKLNEQTSHRLSFQFGQYWKSEDWSSVLTAETRSESAFAANPDRYSDLAIRKDSSEFLPRDIYLQYFSGPLFLRLGYQQVVWGEAFGFAYADIINPKDFREIGLGELSEQRRQIPIANFKYIGKDYSIQLLYIPTPDFHLYPTQGGEFYRFPFTSGPISSASISIVDDSRTGYSSESGVKIGYTLGTYDLSLLYFSGYDRVPLYRQTITSVTPLAIRLNPYHLEYKVYGFTLTADWEEYLFRSEIIYYSDRSFQTYNATSGLGARTANQLVAVLGLDLTQVPLWQVGIQYSIDWLTDGAADDTRRKNLDLLSVRFARDIGRHNRIELTSGISSADGSHILQAKSTRALTKATEVDLGVDYLGGDGSSQFGYYRDSSRVFLLFRLKDSG